MHAWFVYHGFFLFHNIDKTYVSEKHLAILRYKSSILMFLFIWRK